MKIYVSLKEDRNLSNCDHYLSTVPATFKGPSYNILFFSFDVVSDRVTNNSLNQANINALILDTHTEAGTFAVFLERPIRPSISDNIIFFRSSPLFSASAYGNHAPYFNL